MIASIHEEGTARRHLVPNAHRPHGPELGMRVRREGLPRKGRPAQLRGFDEGPRKPFEGRPDRGTTRDRSSNREGPREKHGQLHVRQPVRASICRIETVWVRVYERPPTRLFRFIAKARTLLGVLNLELEPYAVAQRYVDDPGHLQAHLHDLLHLFSFGLEGETQHLFAPQYPPEMLHAGVTPNRCTPTGASERHIG